MGEGRNESPVPELHPQPQDTSCGTIEPHHRADQAPSASALELQFHPLANNFELVDGQKLDKWIADIKTNGQTDLITLYAGKILDGRNRYRACLAAGVEPKFQTYTGDSPWSFVLSKNLHRRHLTMEERGKAAVKSLPIYEAEAAERRKRKSVPTISSEQKQGEAREFAAKDFGVGTTYISAIKKLMIERPDKFEELGKKTLPDIKRELLLEKRAVIVEQIKAEPAPLPDGRFRTIVVDPPWQYENVERLADPSHRGNPHYPTMTLDDIKALPVAERAHEDCVLWLWTTNSFMREAFECLDAWGFKNETILTWDKVHMGLGDTLRNVTEHCLVAFKGNPVLGDAHKSATTLIREERREHSRKPEAFYARVEAVCPGSKLEWFSRQKREGWANCYSAESEKFAPEPPAQTVEPNVHPWQTPTTFRLDVVPKEPPAPQVVKVVTRKRQPKVELPYVALHMAALKERCDAIRARKSQTEKKMELTDAQLSGMFDIEVVPDSREAV